MRISAFFLIPLVFAFGAQAAEGTKPQAIQLSQAAPSAASDKLVARGDDLLALSDVAAARLLYEMAASNGSGEAAARLGMTYDPNYLRELGVVGQLGDPEAAVKWYRIAIDRGYAQASNRLARLDPGNRQAQTPQKIEPDPPPAVLPTPTNLEQVPTREAVKPGVGQADLSNVAVRLDQPVTPAQPPKAAELRVQLAALRTKDAAIEEGVELQIQHWDLLRDKSLTVEPLALKGGRGTLFGVQVGPFSSFSAAETLCSQLKANGQDCFVVQ